jgi:hypothetical protein
LRLRLQKTKSRQNPLKKGKKKNRINPIKTRQNLEWQQQFDRNRDSLEDYLLTDFANGERERQREHEKPKVRSFV